MSKLLSFVKLDFITIKPYMTMKNLWIYVLTMAFMAFSTQSATSVASMILMIASLHVIYPFALGEKSNIDAFYITLSIPRRIVVYGRYLFVLCLDVCALLIGFLIALILSPLFKENLNETLLPIFVVFLLFTIIQLIQLPIYFALGYTKAKVFVMLPYVLLFVLFMLSTHIIESLPAVADFLEEIPAMFVQHKIAVVLLCVGIWSFLLLVSTAISTRSYQKKEF